MATEQFTSIQSIRYSTTKEKRINIKGINQYLDKPTFTCDHNEMGKVSS